MSCLLPLACGSKSNISSNDSLKALADEPSTRPNLYSLNCPDPTLDAVLSFCRSAVLPFPYQPTVDVCIEFQERKAFCIDEINEASYNDEPAVSHEENLVMHHWHIVSQCECFPERRMKVEKCLASGDCDSFAQCTLDLVDGWSPLGDASPPRADSMEEPLTDEEQIAIGNVHLWVK